MEENTDISSQRIIVEASETSVCCNGGGGALGHPAVYLYFGEANAVECYYCGKEFVKQN